MDSGLLWTVIGSAAGVIATVLTAWQIRIQSFERRELRGLRDELPANVREQSGLPVTVPFGRLPSEVRGRDSLLDELRRSVVIHSNPRRFHGRARTGGTWILAGMGGLGKSTMALAAAQVARARGCHVWWVNASDAATLRGGMLEILRKLHAPEEVIQAIQEGAPAAAERAWEFLNGPHLAGRRWLLIYDNADNPEALAASNAASPADHTGWLRVNPAGMVIVTTRHKDIRMWGPGVLFRELTPIDDIAGAKVLADLAPSIQDPDGRGARDLAHRLGGLPLALHLAGSYLSSPFARWHSFDEYRMALDGVELPEALADLDDQVVDVRTTIQRTWDLSLDALASNGRPLARPLLLVLSCYAPATPIPTALLPSTVQLPGGENPRDEAERARGFRSGIEGLAATGLIDIVASNTSASAYTVTVHPIVADVNRTKMRAIGESELHEICVIAVRQLRIAASLLGKERPADWEEWNILIPHITALLHWPGSQLPERILAELLEVSSFAADALEYSGNYTAAELLVRRAASAGSGLGDDHPANLTTRHFLAAAAAGQGVDAEPLFREVLTARQRVLGRDHPDTLRTRYQMTQLIAHARYTEAETLYRELLEDQDRVLGEDDPRTMMTLHSLGWVIGRQWRGREAEVIFRNVLALRDRRLGRDHPDTLNTQRGIAWITGVQGYYSAAERHYRQIIPELRTVLGDRHPNVLRARRDLGKMLTKQGHGEAAEAMLRELLADQRKLLGEGHPSTLFTEVYVADAIAGRGRFLEAETIYRRVLARQQQVLRADAPVIMTTMNGLANVAARQGRSNESEQLLQELIAQHQRLLGATSPKILEIKQELCLVMADQGRYLEAEEILRHVIAEMEQHLGIDSSITQSARRDLERIVEQRDVAATLINQKGRGALAAYSMPRSRGIPKTERSDLHIQPSQGELRR